MISVAELDNIARARIEDAKALLTAGRFDGATYLCGYAVEVALKARICRSLNWTEFPSTGSESQQPDATAMIQAAEEYDQPAAFNRLVLEFLAAH